MTSVQVTNKFESEYPVTYFIGTERECLEIKKVLNKYHEYDYHIEIEVQTVEPKYKSLEDFFSIYEHKHTYLALGGDLELIK